MGVVNTKSTFVTNADAIPMVPTAPHIDGANLRVGRAAIAIGATDTATSVYRLFRIKSSACLHSLKLLNDAMAGSTSFQLGLYDTLANGGAVVSAALFATAFDLSGGSTVGVEVLNQNNSIGNMEKRIWELLALSADPFKDYDICLTAVTIGVAGGKVASIVSWVI